MANHLETQVCIIGAGAAGGIIAFELARRGIEVVVLEAGRKHDFAQRFQSVKKLLRMEYPWRNELPDLDAYTTEGDPGYDLEWNRARGIGGSTLFWEGYTPRFHSTDFQMRTLYGVGQDWPIAYDDLEPYYLKAEAGLGVAGEADDPLASPRSGPFPLPAFEYSYSDAFFRKACSQLGIAVAKLPQARNSLPYGERAQCSGCGTCYVCPTGAKASTELTHIPQAERTGKARVITNAAVLRLEADENRKVRRVVWAGLDRKEQWIEAERYVLAAGGTETPRLLLLSRSPTFPSGLANSTGLVGRGFMSHPSIEVLGRVKENLYPHRVGFSSAISRQFAVGGDRTKSGAFLLEFLNTGGATPDGLARESGLTGAELRKYIEQEFGHTAGIRAYCEQLPDPANTVTLSSTANDSFGNPGPHITYNVGEYERKGIEAAQKIIVKILQEMGATKIRRRWFGPAAHQIGTVRMGDDPRTSVVDKNLRAHDVPNLYLVGSGCFPSATCTHPTLTIAALAIRAAEHMAADLGATV